MDLAERLREERVRLGFTQAQLAALSGIQPNAQCLYENGSRLPRADYCSGLMIPDTHLGENIARYRGV